MLSRYYFICIKGAVSNNNTVNHSGVFEVKSLFPLSPRDAYEAAKEAVIEQCASYVEEQDLILYEETVIATAFNRV